MTIFTKRISRLSVGAANDIPIPIITSIASPISSMSRDIQIDSTNDNINNNINNSMNININSNNSGSNSSDSNSNISNNDNNNNNNINKSQLLLQSQLQLKLQLSNIRAQDHTIYLLDDVVDGLWVLSNGTQRWYPGRITAVNSNGTYSVKYLDGDVHEEKKITEIRHSKNSKLSTARSFKNLHSGRHDTDTSREISESSTRPSGTMSTVSNFGTNDIISSRNSSTDSGSASSPYYSFYNPIDFSTMESGILHTNLNTNICTSTSANDTRLCLFQRKSSFRSSVSSTPRLSGLLEDRGGGERGGRGVNDGIKIVSQAQRALVGPVLLSSDARQNAHKQSNNILEDIIPLKNNSNNNHNSNHNNNHSNHSYNPITICKPIKGLEAAAEKLLKSTDKDRIIQPDSFTPKESPRSAPFLGEIKKPLSWESDGSGSSGESDGQTFAIPSVFPTPRSERKVEGK